MPDSDVIDCVYSRQSRLLKCNKVTCSCDLEATLHSSENDGSRRHRHGNRGLLQVSNPLPLLTLTLPHPSPLRDIPRPDHSPWTVLHDFQADLFILLTPLRAGEYIVEICQNWRNADDEVDERITIVENCWTRTRLQTELITKISPLLDADHHRILDKSIAFLGCKLSHAIHKLQKVLRDEEGDPSRRPGFLGFKKKVRKGKYAFVKEELDSVIQDMESWQKRIDPSYFLMMKLANPIVDQQLQELREKAAFDADEKTIGSLSSPRTSLRTQRQSSPLALCADIRGAVRGTASPKSVILPYDPMERQTLPYCSAVLARRSTSSGADKLFVIDPLHRAAGGDIGSFTTDVRQLVKRLSKADPYTFGLLNCKGAMPIRDEMNVVRSYDLVLRVPEDLEKPRALRQILLSSSESPSLSLTRRLRIAQQLAQSVGYVHTFNFVHKGICPESILVMEDVQFDRDFTYLLGFGNFRAANGSTALIGDSAWEKNIYRHPERQGEYPQDTYRMQHDVYSLGVCLLEIGLWESLVQYVSIDGELKPEKGPAYESFLVWAKASSELESEKGSRAAYAQFMSLKLQEYLVHIAETRLPQKMGEMYKDIVVACLTCLDDDDGVASVTQSRSEKDDINIGVQYVEEILGQLTEITL